MKGLFRTASAVMLLTAGLIVSIGAVEKKCGVVEKVTGPEIIVKYSNVNRPLAMGDKLHINTGSGSVKIIATFPMQTVSKCRVTGGTAANVKKGMIVYFDVPPVKEEPAAVLPAEKTGVKAADDGTVTDMRTGLVWLRNAGSFYGNWDEAIRYCEELEFAGFNDWRMPTKQEFETLTIGVESNKPWDFMLEGLGFVNVNVSDACYWTSTVKTEKTRYSFAPKTGQIWDDAAYDSLRVIPVRGSMKLPSLKNFFKDNGDGTMTDTRTGLVWMKNAGMPGSELGWSAAVSWCGNLTASGKGWRLPSREEMMSLWDGLPNRQGLWRRELAAAGFENIAKQYWTAFGLGTALRLESKYTVIFDEDRTYPSMTKGEKYNVWPVRGEGTVCRNREPFFKDSGPYTLTDTRTGLMWAKQACCIYRKWNDDVDYGDSVKLAGFDDWRIATVADMRSLLAGIPAGVDERFYLHRQGFFDFEEKYWLASEYISNGDSAWYYDMARGSLRVKNPDERLGCWLVRGGKADAPDTVSAFEKKGEDILVDIRTGAMWLRNANTSNGPLTLDEAKDFCAKLRAGGYAEWRLPTVDEFNDLLSGMTKFKDSRKQFKKQGFTDVQDYYWTSDAVNGKKTNYVATFADSAAGNRYSTNAGQKEFVWAVRSDRKKEE